MFFNLDLFACFRWRLLFFALHIEMFHIKFWQTFPGCHWPSLQLEVSVWRHSDRELLGSDRALNLSLLCLKNMIFFVFVLKIWISVQRMHFNNFCRSSVMIQIQTILRIWKFFEISFLKIVFRFLIRNMFLYLYSMFVK